MHFAHQNATRSSLTHTHGYGHTLAHACSNLFGFWWCRRCGNVEVFSRGSLFRHRRRRRQQHRATLLCFVRMIGAFLLASSFSFGANELPHLCCIQYNLHQLIFQHHKYGLDVNLHNMSDGCCQRLSQSRCSETRRAHIRWSLDAYFYIHIFILLYFIFIFVLFIDRRRRAISCSGNIMHAPLTTDDSGDGVAHTNILISVHFN